MYLLNTKTDVDYLIKNSEMVLLYFHSSTCGICNIVGPKIDALLKHYPKINCVKIDAEIYIEIAAHYNVFTIPSIIMFIDGKEAIRMSRFISMIDLENKITRYYDLYY
jgi:thiol-disulfide isomerase/thioredoxin